MSSSETLSIIAITLSILSLCKTFWEAWRDRPRLHFYIDKVIFQNKSDKKNYNMLRIRVCNVGFRPIILTKFIALGENNHTFEMGLNDNPYAYYGKEKQVFPSIINPGATLVFHPMKINSLRESKFEYYAFLLFDSFKRPYYLNLKIEPILFNLGLANKYTRPKLYHYFINFIKTRIHSRQYK